jgi:hypothetical protein
MIETGIFSLLSMEPTISALVADRVYPVILPTEASMPAVTYQIVGGSSQPTLTEPGVQRVRLQVDCWASDAYLTAAAVRAALTMFLANKGGVQLVDGTFLQGVQYISPLDFYASGDELFRCGAEFYLFYYFAA